MPNLRVQGFPGPLPPVCPTTTNMNVENNHGSSHEETPEVLNSTHSTKFTFPTVKIEDTDLSRAVPRDRLTSQSAISVASSDTNFTAITSTTTTTSASNAANEHTLAHYSNNADPSRLSPHRSYASNDPDSEIRTYYQQQPPQAPDLGGEMEKWYTMTDRYGFLQESTHPTTGIDKIKQHEVERAQKWAKMAKSKEANGEVMHYFDWTPKFVKRVYKGIPDCWRRDAWYFLASDGLKNTKTDRQLKEKYEDNLQLLFCAAHDQSMLNTPSEHERQIDLDIPRTMRDHIVLRERYGYGQRVLFNVLRSFSNYDEEVGYCQGMSNVVATLVIYFEEEKTFTMLVHMFEKCNLHDLFIPGFPALVEAFYIQERLIEKHLPKVSKHMRDLDITSSSYSTRWYITLFTGGIVNYHTLLRIWDVMHLCGFDILYYVAIALLKSVQTKILKGDFETNMELLGSIIPIDDDDKFMKLKFMISKPSKINMPIIPRRRFMFLSKCRLLPLASTSTASFVNKRFLHRNVVLDQLRSRYINANRLDVKKASELKMEAALTGVAISGTKKELIERIMLHYDTVLLDNTVTKAYTAVPESVISIDMGYRNLAFAHVSREQKVLRWRRVDLDIDNHHPSQSASTVTRFVRDQLLESTSTTSTDCAIVIERQRFRSMGGFSVLEHTLRVNMVEAMLWSALQCMTDPRMIKEAVSPVAVEKYWSDIKGYNSEDSQLSSKKKRSELLVAKLLFSNYIDCNPELLNMFASEKKKDDLSDSMLQGLAWLDWRKYTQKNVQEILQ